MTRLNPITTPRHQLRAEKAARNKEAALNAFIGKKAEIDEALARLAMPRRSNWRTRRPARRWSPSPKSNRPGHRSFGTCGPPCWQSPPVFNSGLGT